MRQHRSFNVTLEIYSQKIRKKTKTSALSFNSNLNHLPPPQKKKKQQQQQQQQQMKKSAF